MIWKSLISFIGLLSMLGCVSEPTYDVVIYGGTSAGISAAVQTARLGKKVILIEPGSYLGGLTSGGLGATDIGNKAARSITIVMIPGDNRPVSPIKATGSAAAKTRCGPSSLTSQNRSSAR